MKSNHESNISMKSESSQPKANRHPFLYGAIVGTVIGWPLILYVSRDTGDAPSVAISAGLAYIAVTLAGGIGGLLLQGMKEVLLEEESPKASYVIGFTVLVSILGVLLWFCYATMIGIMAFRKYVMDIEAMVAIREYKNEINEYLAKTGKLPTGIEELKKPCTPSMNQIPPRKRVARGLKVEYVPVSQTKEFSLRTYHLDGKKEYLVTSKSGKIMSRTNGVGGWASLE